MRFLAAFAAGDPLVPFDQALEYRAALDFLERYLR